MTTVLICRLLKRCKFFFFPLQLTVREELVSRVEYECVNEKPFAEEGGKRRGRKC